VKLLAGIAAAAIVLAVVALLLPWPAIGGYVVAAAIDDARPSGFAARIVHHAARTPSRLLLPVVEATP
jgi:hypothetical protein